MGKEIFKIQRTIPWNPWPNYLRLPFSGLCPKRAAQFPVFVQAVLQLRTCLIGVARLQLFAHEYFHRREGARFVRYIKLEFSQISSLGEKLLGTERERERE